MTSVRSAAKLTDMSDQWRSEAESAFLLGDILARQGDVESATGAFHSAIAMDDPEWSSRAAYHLGELLWQTRDPDGAEAALRVAADAGHPEWTPAAQVVQGVICAARQDMDGAMRADGAAIASGHPTGPGSTGARCTSGGARRPRRSWPTGGPSSWTIPS